MNFQDKLSELRNKNSQISKLRKEIRDASSELFDEFRDYIFDKYQELESFSWTQYTPYFNDGDTCVFYADTDYIKVNGELAQESDWYSEMTLIDYGTWNNEKRIYENRVQEPNQSYDELLVKACNEITDFLNNFDNDFYLTKFGDHAEITMTKSGIDISDYDHD